MLPSDESLLPPLHVSIGFFSAYGVAIAGAANLVHRLPFFNRTRPHTLLIGGIVGAFGGYVLHHGAHAAHQRISASEEYLERYREFIKSKQS